jgi:hypothetical protein
MEIRADPSTEGLALKQPTNSVIGVNSSYRANSDVWGPYFNWHARVDGASQYNVASWLQDHGAKTVQSPM